MKSIPLESGCYYHVYNCGVNGEIIFRDANDYILFYNSINKFLTPIANLYAWCLMSNHFHFFFFIKKNIVYRFSKESSKADISPIGEDVSFKDGKWLTTDLSDASHADSINKNKAPNPSKDISQLVSSHTRYINRKYNRHGNLFERPFKRNKIENRKYMRNLIIYIHNNPVHHGFCKHPFEYSWSSYHKYISDEINLWQNDLIQDWFKDNANFIKIHDKKANESFMDKELEF